MAKLSDVKDSNGTSLQAYADSLTEKVIEAGGTVVVLVMLPPAQLHVISNVEGNVLADSLAQMSKLMRQKPSRITGKEFKNPSEKVN